MKRAIFALSGLLFLCVGSVTALDEINIGRVQIPRDFVHDGKAYAKGTYQVKLVEKEGNPVFLVSDAQGTPLLEDLAVTKPYLGNAKNFKPRISRTVLKDYEYYRIKVTTPEAMYMAYFLLKGQDQPSSSESEAK